MSLLVNLRHLEAKSLHLKGELSPAELEVESLDEVIHVTQPLSYELEAQKLDHAVLVQGTLSLTLNCECVRCLRPFQQALELEHWTCHLPLEGEEKVLVVNDGVDLTPYIREDIVLAFPQHPLCDPECGGLAQFQKKPPIGASVAADAQANPAAWAALDKLKL